jgi:hypothetical protein
MANPTTNYSFAMPTNTDLVKDLPADFDIFGQAVDDRIKALNPSTTLGDIEYRSSTANTNTRLGIGTSGQVLSVSGGVPAWTTPAGGGSLTLLSTTTLSGTTTTISGISGSYNNLYIIIKNINLASNSTPRLNFNGATTNLGVGQEYPETAGASPSVTTNNNNNLNTTHLAGNTENIWVFDVFDYASTTNYKPFRYFGSNLNGSSVRFAYYQNSVFTSNSAITSVAITTSGTVTQNGGTVLIYGVK